MIVARINKNAEKERKRIMETQDIYSKVTAIQGKEKCVNEDKNINKIYGVLL
jgi:hypothetical protein